MAKLQMDLDVKHTLYKKLKPIREKSRDLYDGAEVVKAKKSAYLFAMPTEGDDAYSFRWERAVYDNWLGVVVDTRIALQWRKAPVRDAFPPDIKPFIDDIDGLGTPADAFFKYASNAAGVDGLAWVFVDKTALPPIMTDSTGKRFVVSPAGKILFVGDNGLSLAQENELGLRAFCKLLPAECVYDWKWGDDGKLEWIVIAQCLSVKAGPGFEEQTIPQRVVWTRNTWSIYEPENPDKAEGEINWIVRDGNRGVNALGEIPIQPFYGFKVLGEEHFGWPVGKDIIGHCISVYNKFSDRDAAEYLTNNPVPWMKAPENPGTVEVGHMNAIWLDSSGDHEVGCGYMEPTGNGLTASRESERDLIRRIREIALQQAQKETGQVQSADTLREQARIYTSSLSSSAVTLQSGETNVWRLMARWQNPEARGEDYAFEGKVTYNTDFDDSLVDSAFIKVLSDAQRGGQLSKPTLWKIWQKGEVLPDDFDPKRELDLIAKDRESDAMPGAVPVPPGSGNNPPVPPAQPGMGGDSPPMPAK